MPVSEMGHLWYENSSEEHLVTTNTYNIVSVVRGHSIPMWWSKSRSVLSNSLRPHGLYSPWNSPGQNTGVGSLSLLQGIFPTQGSNPGLPHCRQILYQLSHKGSLRILEWIAYPFSRGSSWPRNHTGVSLQANSVPTELWGKPNTYL